MNILDLVIIFILFLMMVQSYRVGFLDELLSLVVVIGGGYLAYILSPMLIPYLDFITGSKIIVHIAAIIILFIVFYILGKLIKTFILDTVNETELNGFDKFMGMLLGFFKGIVIVGLILFVISFFEITPIKGIIEESFISSKILYAITEYKNYFVS